MKQTITRLTIPMNKALRDALDRKAGSLGFDSPQALLRYVSKTIVDERQVTFGEPEMLSPAAEKRYAKQLEQYEKDKKAGKIKSFDNVEDFLADLKK